MNAKENTIKLIRADMQMVNALLDQASQYHSHILALLDHSKSNIEKLRIEEADLFKKLNELKNEPRRTI